jgi:aspartate racemase
MKTMGVLGGIGPQATMDFVRRVHAIAQQTIPQDHGSGYPPMIVSYFRHPPVMTDENNRAVQPPRPNPAFLEAAGRLGALSDFLVITANAPHIFVGEVEAAAGRPVLSMIDLAVGEIQRRRPELVGLLGFGRSLVYERALDEAGIPHQGLPAGERRPLDRMIKALMEGSSGAEGTRVALATVDALRARGANPIVLGCTEIPLLLDQHQNAPDLINPGSLLAEAAVAYALDDETRLL